jgi:hypothetical protein
LVLRLKNLFTFLVVMVRPPLKVIWSTQKFKKQADPAKMLSLAVRRRGGPRRGNSRHRFKHAATRLPPAGPPEAHAGGFIPQTKSLTSRL